MRVLVIGGGIGGLAAAIALRRAGFEAAVFEWERELAERFRNWYVPMPAAIVATEEAAILRREGGPGTALARASAVRPQHSGQRWGARGREAASAGWETSARGTAGC